MSCCTEYLNLGCKASCGTLTLDHEAAASGTYTVIVEGALSGYAFNITGTIGENLAIDLSNFNEYGVTKFQVQDPSGELIEITSDEVDYTCFKVKVSVIYNVLADSTDAPECCDYTLIEVTNDDSYQLTYSQWSRFGDIPTIEVYLNDGSGYTKYAIQPVYDQFPNPTTITVTIPGVLALWYIKIK